jgi:hypothetical protein
MMERKWFAASHPWPLVESVRGRVSDRKMRLFAVGCCRMVWPMLTDARSCRAVEVAEGYAEGLASAAALAEACEAAQAAYANAFLNHDEAARAAWGCALPSAFDAAWNSAVGAEAAGLVMKPALRLAAPQADLFRHLVGNPFRVRAVEASWLRWNHGVVLDLVRACVEDPSQFPLLADALEDAGCSDTEILDHCRRGGDHPRGCWVLDLLLGKP